MVKRKKDEEPTRKQPVRGVKSPPTTLGAVTGASRVAGGRITKAKPTIKSPRKPRAAATAAAKALKDAAAAAAAEEDDDIEEEETTFEPESEPGDYESTPANKKQMGPGKKPVAAGISKKPAPAGKGKGKEPINAGIGPSSSPWVAAGAKDDAEDQPDMDEAANPYKDTETQDYALKPVDIKRGTIISMGMHDQYSRALGYDPEYEKRCVRHAGDNCGLVSSKYRKFVIIGVHDEHFVTLPIYTSYIGSKTRRNHDRIHDSNRHEHADIIDESLRKRRPPVDGRGQPTGRGRVHGSNGYLWSKEAAVNVAVTNWRRMDDSATVMLSRPVCFNKWAKCKVLSALDAPSLANVLRWAKENFEIGLLGKSL